MVQGGMFTQPFCSEDLSVLLKNEKLKYVLIRNEKSVFNPLPPLDKKKILLIYPSSPSLPTSTTIVKNTCLPIVFAWMSLSYFQSKAFSK